MLLFLAKGAIFSILLIASAIGTGSIINQRLNKLPPNPTSAPMSVSVNTPTPTVEPVALHTPIPTTDPDPPVHCKIHENCGGGTTPLKQSECAQSTCCGINGKWIFYKSKQLCVEDQQKGRSTNSQQYYPTYQPLQTLYIPQYQQTTQPTTNPAPTAPPNNYGTSQSVQDCLNRLAALGAGDSSAAQQCYTSPGSVPASGMHCYATWDDYFKAHPGYVGNVAGLGSTPPCD